MSTVTSQITSLAFVYSTVYSGTDQRKHQSSASLAFVQGIHRGPVNSLHKWPVTRKMFPFDDVITRKMNAAGPHCISQYDWLWLWLSAINQKAISWTNVDQIQLYEVTKGKWVDKLFSKKIFSAFGQQFHYMVNDIKSSLMHNESPVSVCAYFISFFMNYLKPLPTWMFVQQLVRMNNKKYIKVVLYWLFVWKIHWWWVPLMKSK